MLHFTSTHSCEDIFQQVEAKNREKERERSVFSAPFQQPAVI